MKRRTLSNSSRFPVTRQDPANSNIAPKGTVVGGMAKEQQSEAAKAELAKFSGSNKTMPSPGVGEPSIGSKSPSSAQSAEAAMLAKQKAGPQIPAGAVKPASSGIVSSSKEAIDKMPPMSFVPTIPRGAPRMSDADMRAFESMARSTPQPGPRMPVSAPSAPVDRGPPMVAPGSPAMPTPGGVAPRTAMPAMTRPTPASTPSSRPSTMPPMMPMKKGGQAKAYASGGSVKGAGIAQRGVKKCKVY